GEDAKVLIAGAHKRGQDMLKLITSLLDLARIEEGMPLDLQPVPVAPLLADQAAAAEAEAQAKDVSLRVAPAEGEVVVMADPDRLRQVVANLVSNAIKYTPAGGSVTLSSESDGPYGVVRVADTGIGIPADALAHVFQPFYRVSDRVPDVEGTGLGLSIVKAI